MQRKCGDCQLCCRLLPVSAIGKNAGDRCSYQRFKKGCAVHHTRSMPTSCKVWHCVWLKGPNAEELRRPDHVHYVVDPTPDFVALGEDEKTGTKVPALQVWVDPQYRDAHRDLGLRDYIRRAAIEHGMIAIIRYGSNDAFALVAPEMSETGQWLEMNSRMMVQPHSMTEIAAVHFEHARKAEAQETL